MPTEAPAYLAIDRGKTVAGTLDGLAVILRPHHADDSVLAIGR